MDLQSLDTSTLADSGVDMIVLHPTQKTPVMGDDKKPITIRLLGMDSKKFTSVQRAKINQRLKDQQRRKVATAEQLDEDGLDIIVAATVGWSQNFTIGAAKLEFSSANARRLYTEFPFIREMADEFIADRSNFLRP